MALWNKIDWPIEQMRKWYEEDGMTLQEIADRLGQKQKNVNKAAKTAGFRMRRTGPQCRQGLKHFDKAGYVLVRMPTHPAATKGGYVREHRLVAESFLGRFLLPTEVVHHVNDDPSDNRPENLVVFESNGDHLAATLTGKVPNWTEGGRERILKAVRERDQSASTPDPSAPDGSGLKQRIGRRSKRPKIGRRNLYVPGLPLKSNGSAMPERETDS